MHTVRARLFHPVSWIGVFILTVAFASILANDAAAETGELKVLSFNIRYLKQSGEDKAENNWKDPEHPRRDRVIRLIRDYDPDVLGVQEARNPQVKDLQSALTDYDFYGIGRDDGKTEGEYSGIFYRKDRFQREEVGSIWLSATPENPGTTFHTRPGAVPRIASWVKLEDKQSGREFLVLNMHWDNESEPARRQSATLVRERLASLAKGNLPTIVMGDLNANEDSPAVKELLGSDGAAGPRLADSYRRAHPERRPDEATFGNWAGVTAGWRIDFILTTSDFSPMAAEIVRTTYDGRWPSDHYPMAATLRWHTAD